MTFDVEGVAAEEERLVAVEAGHRGARADAFVLAGAHLHDRSLESTAGFRVPCGMERRVEWEPVALDVDAIDGGWSHRRESVAAWLLGWRACVR